jgi:hypothetical protein
MTKPLNQPAAFVPQCGCDNVTYWNETIAGRFGANVKSAGVCPAGTGAVCKPTGPKCAVGRYCNHDTAVCGLQAANGVCWGLPTDCPGEAQYRLCPGAGGTAACLSYCEAIQKEKPFSKDQINCQ